MPFARDSNAIIDGDPVALAASAARSTNGNDAPLAMGTRSTLRLTLDVTAASGGTPSLTVTVQHSEDGGTWTDHSAFTAATSPGKQRKVFAGLDRFVRVKWAITGTTPSFTFAVNGERV